MSEPPPVAAPARSAWHAFVRARRPLSVYEILFKLLQARLFVPAVAVVLAIVLPEAGHIAVRNKA